MCGIAGVFDTRRTPREDVLSAMNACLEHRGPDESGTYVRGPVGLTHRRLSIVDPEGGQQPIRNEDDTVAVIFNGEIYNHRRLREELAAAGHDFTTDTDTEVIVHAYEEYGDAFVERLRGMFAFALWDDTEERLLLARDRFGVKPLVVASDDSGRLAFASEVSALLDSDVDHGGLDMTAAGLYFGFGYVPAPKSMFRNVRKLCPGELLTVTADGTTSRRYYRLSVTPTDDDLSTAATTLRRLVERSVRRRLMSDVPLGAFLSGGIDSSILVGTMADLLDDPVETFTVGFDEATFDETWAAREVAEHHGTNHHEFVLSPSDLLDIVPAAVDRLGEPYADQSLVPTYAVAENTADQVKVALSGDGADELFFGYDRYRAEYYSRYYRQLPAVLRRRCLEPMVERLPASRANRGGELTHAARTFVRGSGPETLTDRQFEWLRYGDAETDAAVTGADVRAESVANLRALHATVDDQLPATMRDDMARFQTADVQHFLPNRILQKSDMAGMFNSLEVRVPFVDTDVVEYALSLPREHKITPRTRKRVLKRAFADRLPSSIRERDKQGFDMPIGEWFKHELADEFTDVVRGTDLGVLDTDATMSRYRDHVADRKEYADFLWSVYVFKRWGQRMRRTGVL